MTRSLTDEEITRQLAALDGWARDADQLRAGYRAPDFATGIEFVRLVAGDAEEMDHHPDITISFTTITWALSTHSAGAITQLDVELAHRIAETAAQLGCVVTT